MINYQFVGNSDPKLELVTKEKLQGAKFFEEELFRITRLKLIAIFPLYH